MTLFTIDKYILDNNGDVACSLPRILSFLLVNNYQMDYFLSKYLPFYPFA